MIDITLLVDMILQGTTFDVDIYEHWAADVFVDEALDISDQTTMVNMILNNPSCTGTPRLLTNSFINISVVNGLLRGGGEQVEINMVNQEDVRAAHFEFVFEDIDVINVELNNNYSFMTLNWLTREDTLAILIFGAEGQSIPAGSHNLGFITLSSNLGRNPSISPNYFYGEYSNSGYDLFSFEYTQDSEGYSTLPNEYRLHTPYPNPFNSTVAIKYDLPVDSYIDITIYDLQGREVKQLINGNQEAGSYQLFWSGKGATSSVYFVKLTTNSHQFTQKLMLLK